MSDNTEQFRLIVWIKENLELLLANDPNVFVASDLLWYPVEGNNKLSQAPNVMVVFGRPKGDRGSYQQWNSIDCGGKLRRGLNRQKRCWNKNDRDRKF